MGTTYQKRYFAISSNGSAGYTLQYFLDTSPSTKKGEVLLKGATISKGSRPGDFTVTAKSKPTSLRASSTAEADAWISDIQRAIGLS